MSGEVFRYPDHWYHDAVRLHCIIPLCGFVTASKFKQEQWTELHNHCISTMGPDHQILVKMLNQGKCVIDDCGEAPFQNNRDESRRTRNLFHHELVAHGSTKMSDVCSFVTLSREGRVRRGNTMQVDSECEKLAYDRMLEKVSALPGNVTTLLFQKNGFHDPNTQTRENLGKILTADPLAQAGETPPYWWPIRAEDFLDLCEPDPNDPADVEWGLIWTYLREEYAEGRI